MRTKGIEPPQPVMVLDSKSSASQPIAPHPQDLYKLYLWIKPEITFTSKFLWTRRESNPPLSPCKGETPALEHASPNTHLKYDKFKELCAFGGIEPTHI